MARKAFNIPTSRKRAKQPPRSLALHSSFRSITTPFTDLVAKPPHAVYTLQTESRRSAATTAAGMTATMPYSRNGFMK